MRVFRKKDLIIFGISIIIAGLYTYISNQNGFLHNLINIFFIIGIFHVSIGFCVYVRNAGLFKLFSYASYKRQFRKHKNADPSARPLSMADYAHELAKNPKTMKEYYIIGLPFLIVSFVLGFAQYQ